MKIEPLAEFSTHAALIRLINKQLPNMIVITLETINNVLETLDLFSNWEYINVLVRISEVVSKLLMLISYLVTKSIKLLFS